MSDMGSGGQPGQQPPPPGSQPPGGTPPPQPQPAGQGQPQPQPPGPARQPLPPPAAGAPGGSQPATSGWYNGPLPIAGLAPRETVGSAIGRTAVKAITALIVLGFGLLVIPFLFIGLIGALGAAAGGGVEDPNAGRTLIAGDDGADVTLVAIPIRGLILGEDQGGGGGLFAATDVTYGYTVQEELEELADDDSVDGIILELDTPGGTIFGSRAIADGVAAYREATGKPVIAYVSGISASGGVYAMAGADAIYADYGTLIGSIGVIFGPFTTYDDVRAIDGGILGGGVTTEGGITQEFLTAGRSKDFGNPYRPITDEERAVLQEGLDDAYADFVAHVAAGRPDLTEAEIEKDLGALIFGEQQAVSNGLIDGVANRSNGFELAAEAAGLQDGQTWAVERLDSGTPGFLDLLAARAAGTAGTDEADAPAITPLRIEPLCLGTGTILAYHGDPAVLCAGQ
ncbi:MAG: S49 family peptidase [Actinomycetota bacterium]